MKVLFEPSGVGERGMDMSIAFRMGMLRDRGICIRVMSAAAAAALVLIAVVLPGVSSGSTPIFGSWSSSVEISADEHFWMASDGDHIYSHSYEWMVASHDGGSSWSAGAPHTGMITASGGILYRVNMSDEDMSSGTVRFSYSVDYGATWSKTVDVFTLNSQNAGAFGIHLIKGVLFVYSYDDAGESNGAVIVSKSEDFGATWSSPITVDHNVHVEDPIPSDIVYDDEKIYLAYWNYGENPTLFYEVVIVESSDLGDTWGDRRVISNTGVWPQMKADMGCIYVTYWDFASGLGSPNLSFIRSADGDSWTEPVTVGPVTDFHDASGLHALAVSSGEVFVAYGDYVSSAVDLTVKINYSADNGDTWFDMGDVTETSTNTIFPALSVSGSRLHFTWVDIGTETWWGAGTTHYRSMLIPCAPIPEFTGVLLPAVAMLVALMVALRLSRSRGGPERPGGEN